MTYIIQSTALSEEFIHTEIEKCMNALYCVNDMVYDFWISTLFDDDGNKRSRNWNEENLQELYQDVEDNQ
jgi:hypothetical protein